MKTAWSEPPVAHIVADLDHLDEEYAPRRARGRRTRRPRRTFRAALLAAYAALRAR